MALNISFNEQTRILITGGARGIGRQFVQRFHDAGATVYTVDYNAANVEKLRQELPKVKAEILDLSVWDSTKTVIESFGPIDHVINCAGVFITENFVDISHANALCQLSVNILAVVNVSQSVSKSLIERGASGCIINMSSGAAKRIGVTTAIYSATKAAIENLTKTMAVELAPHNIRVVCIGPGGVDTPMLTSVPEKRDECLSRHIIKRLIKPEEIANLAMFLLSSHADMITGETIMIDGGYSIS